MMILHVGCQFYREKTKILLLLELQKKTDKISFHSLNNKLNHRIQSHDVTIQVFKSNDESPCEAWILREKVRVLVVL